jgi:hypothetical protein
MADEFVDIGLVIFDCGCIGFPAVGDMPVVKVRDCTYNDAIVIYSVGAGHSECLMRKTVVPCPPKIQATIVLELAAIARDGNKFRELKALLK